jgi:hypothetical protein
MVLSFRLKGSLKWLCSKSLPCNFLGLTKPHRLVLGLQRASIITTKHIWQQSASTTPFLSRGNRQTSSKQQKCKNTYFTIDEICEAHPCVHILIGWIVTGWMNLASMFDVAVPHPLLNPQCLCAKHDIVRCIHTWC